MINWMPPMNIIMVSRVVKPVTAGSLKKIRRTMKKRAVEKPMAAHNIAEFTLVPNGAGTEVTWSMRGPTPFIGKIFHVFMNMDRMVGDDFAAGLGQIKALAEG